MKRSPGKEAAFRLYLGKTREGIVDAEFGVLLALSMDGESEPAVLAKRVERRYVTMRRHFSSMAKRGLIRRRLRDGHGRAILWDIEPKGREVLERVLAAA